MQSLWFLCENCVYMRMYFIDIHMKPLCKTTYSARTDTPVRGFTLLEIAVCLVILGVLVLVASYNLPRAQEQALRTQCRGNLRTLYEAVRQYAQDHRLAPGSVIHVTSLYPRYYSDATSGVCPTSKLPYQSVFTNMVPPVCRIPGHRWSPHDAEL